MSLSAVIPQAACQQGHFFKDPTCLQVEKPEIDTAPMKKPKAGAAISPITSEPETHSHTLIEPVTKNKLTLPQYNGLESQYEDVVYTVLRLMAKATAHTVKIKRTNTQIDTFLRTKGKASSRLSCDAYIFSSLAGDKKYVLEGLLELESTGNLSKGIIQIKQYAKLLSEEGITPKLLVIDGKRYWRCEGKETEEGEMDFNVGVKLLEWMFSKQGKASNANELGSIIEKFRKLTRSRPEVQKHRAELMTALAAIHRCVRDTRTPQTLDIDIEALKQRKTGLEQKVVGAWETLVQRIKWSENSNLIREIYNEIIPHLVAKTEEADQDLYGFFYEELSEKGEKQLQGEYYTPRHIAKPIIRHMITTLNIDLNYKGVIFDPFIGSGGFPFTLCQILKEKGISPDDLNDFAKRCVFGADKADIHAALLNLYLVGDGSANISQVVRWTPEIRPEVKRVEKRWRGW